MDRYTETDADLNGYEQEDPEAIGEKIAGWLLLAGIVAGLVWLILKWWA